MAKLKDGFYKQTAEAIGSDLHVLLAGGGSKALSDFATSTGVVTALGTNGNYVTWTKNGTANNLTVPYATKAGTLDCFTRKATANCTWGTLTASNGYTPIYWGDSASGGGIGFSDKGGQTFMQIDGDYYAQEGAYKVWHAGNLTKVSQLTNDAGYLTSLPSHTHSYVSYGGVVFTPANAKLTSADVLALTGGWSMKKGTWDYAVNGYIKAGDFGNIDLAGTSILTFGGSSAYTQLFITAPTQSGHTGITNEMLFYNDHGADYHPAWTRVLTNRNYNAYAPKLDGTGASGTWAINISGNASTATKATKDVDGNAIKTTYLRQVVVPNNTTNDFNTFANMTLTGRVDPTTGASLKNAPWTGGGPAGGYGVLTYLFNGSGYGTQMAWGYNSNRIYIRPRYYSNGPKWATTWDSLALTSDIPTKTSQLTNDSGFITGSYLPLAGGTMTGTPYINMPAKAATIADSQPFGITYGRIQSYGTITIAADTDASKNEFVNITAGYGVTDASAANGLSIGYDTLKWKGQGIIHGGNIGSQSVNYANSAGSATDQTARNAAATAQSTANGKWTYNESTIKAVKVNKATYADSAGSTGYSSLTGALQHSNNTITTTSNDTTAKWGALHNTVHFYGTSGQLNNQPSQYGILVNFNNDNSEVHQLWLTQASGDAYHRGGNSGGWSGTWRKFLDSSNYTSYVNTTNFPGLNKTGTVTSVATGAGLTGGTITGSGTISINSTYQTYISNGNTAYGWGNHANAGYIKSTSILKGWSDTRSAATKPNDYNGAFKVIGIKSAGTTLGLTSTQAGDYATIIGWRGWSDSSGGYAWEIASTDKNRLYVRSGSTTSWNNGWKAIAYTSDIPTKTSQLTNDSGYITATSLDGYVNAIETSGSGNAITSASKSGKKITFTKGTTFLTAHQTIYALTIKNSAGTTQLTYTPNSAAGSITLTKAMVGLGNVANSTYAGGTKVTLNGTDKGASTASFYAPTTAGTSNYVLISGGTGTAPSWTAQSNLSVGTASKLGTATKGSATNPIYLSSGSPMACTYYLKATVNSGTTSKLAYYSGTNAVSAYTSTLGSSNRPIYLNAGVPTACTWGTGAGSSTTSSYLISATSTTAGLQYNTSVRLYNNAVYSSYGFYESSDERLKTILNPVKVNLDELSKLRKVYYLWKDDRSSEAQLGVIAQDIQKLYPELVSVNSDTGYLSLAYDKLSVVALAAVDELHKTLNEVKEENKRLRELVKQLETKLMN